MDTNYSKLRPVSARKAKRFRSAFTTEQINILEQQFQKFPYINSEHRKEVAAALNMQERAVKIWFQNRRMREKKESTAKETDSEGNKGREDISNDCKQEFSNFCPIQSTKDLHPHGLPETSTINVDISYKRHDDRKTNFNTAKVNFFKDTLNYIIPNPYETKPVQENKPVKTYVNKATDIAIDLFKSYKIENIAEESKTKNHDNNFKTAIPKANGDHFSKFVSVSKLPEDLSITKTNLNKQDQNRPVRAEALRKPTYLPVMPTIYAHPFASPGGVIWKPMNMMPLVTGAPISVPNSPQEVNQNQRRNCNCNCHNKNQVPINFDQINNPYSQYVVSVPF